MIPLCREFISNKCICLHFVGSSILLVLSVSFIACTQQSLPNKIVGEYQSNSSSQSTPESIRKLRVCKAQNGSLESETGTIKVPTFRTSDLKFVLEEYEIDRDFVLEACSTGEEPGPPFVSIFSKDVYKILNDALETSKSIPDIKVLFEILRNDSILFYNGHLSVRDATRNMVHYYSPEEFCIEAVNENDSVDIRTCMFSSERPRLQKCCPLGMVLGGRYCVGQTDVDRWDPGYMDSRTWKTLSIDKVNPIYTYNKLQCIQEHWEVDDCELDFHPVTDNTIAYIGAYRTWELLGPNVNWCMDRKKTAGKDGHEQIVTFMLHCLENVETKEHQEKQMQARISWIYMINMYIGATFHLLTTLVYLITWSKQNLHGKTLCSCTASLFFMQTFLGTAHLLGIMKTNSNSILCFLNSISAQYFMIAAFTWLLVVNYDMSKTFRSIRANARNSSRRFLTYSAFGWLFPLMISLISVGLDLTFTCRSSRVPVPDFGKHYCFVAPWSQGIYVYYILGILIFLSFVFAALTLFGLYKIKKDTHMVDLRSTKRADDKQSFLLFMKLGVVMGLTWIFEVISWAATNESQNRIGWIIVDLYNALSAILIFLIFVCKRTTLNMLEQSIPRLQGITAALSKLSSTFSGDSSIDNTATTAADGSNNDHSKKNDSQNVAVVRFTRAEENATGKVNVAYEEPPSK